jgi:hypothetical protein
VAALMPGQYIIRITNECFACGDGILLARSFVPASFQTDGVDLARNISTNFFFKIVFN